MQRQLTSLRQHCEEEVSCRLEASQWLKKGVLTNSIRSLGERDNVKTRALEKNMGHSIVVNSTLKQTAFFHVTS